MPPTQKTSSRFVAIETLCRLQEKREPVNAIFNRVLAEYPLEKNDRRLANSIIQGLLRNRQFVDSILQQLCRQPLKKLHPFIHQTLRVGLFQVLFLDRIPESAAVNESVKAVQAARLPKKLQGFVNAVLRNSIRRKKELLGSIDNPDKPILNHPRWLCARWEKRYGLEESVRICRHNNRPPPLSLQVNRSRGRRSELLALFQENGIEARAGSLCEDSLIIEDFHGVVPELPGFREGLFQVQDQGATLLAKLLAPLTEGAEYLDACAGVGGKTSILLQLAAPARARVAAVEPDAMRQVKFKENMQRLHPELDIPLFAGGLQEFRESSDRRFHGILLDAPCSGTGVIGRHPDIRWNRKAEELARYRETQLQLLQAAAPLLQSDGVLVYATCSLEGEENEEVIERFLAAAPDFSLEDCTPQLPPAARCFVTKGCFAPLPGPETDGFFGARLIKKH